MERDKLEQLHRANGSHSWRTDGVFVLIRTPDSGFEALSLGRVAVVRGDDPAELLFASDNTLGLRLKRRVEHIVVNPGTSVRSLRIVVPDPSPNDVVKLVLAEAHEMV